MLGRNQSYRLSSDVIISGEARRLSLDVISPKIGYLSVNMIPSMVHRLLEHNKSCGLSKCKMSHGVVHMLLECNTPRRLSKWERSWKQVFQMQ